MRPDRGFDEVMIVNPFDPRAQHPTTIPMRFHPAPEMGYYAEPPEMAGYGYGYYAEPPPEMGYYAQAPDLGYYAQTPEMGYYAQSPELGYYAQPPAGYGYYGEPDMAYAEAPEMGWYGEPPEMAGYAEPIEYYAEETPMAGYAGYGYAQSPEMVGYSEYEPLSEEYPGMSEYDDYAEPPMDGYVRAARPTYNPGCPIPTNVAGYGEGAPLEGYVKPVSGNPACDQFVPQPGASPSMPEAFRPLW